MLRHYVYALTTGPGKRVVAWVVCRGFYDHTLKITDGTPDPCEFFYEKDPRNAHQLAEELNKSQPPAKGQHLFNTRTEDFLFEAHASIRLQNQLGNYLFCSDRANYGREWEKEWGPVPHYIGQLVQCSSYTLMKLKNLGVGSVEHLEYVLAKYELRLCMDVGDWTPPRKN